jgi:hypothetical protein
MKSVLSFLWTVVTLPFAMAFGLGCMVYFFFKKEPSVPVIPNAQDFDYESTAPVARRLDAIEDAFTRQGRRKRVNVSSN